MGKGPQHEDECLRLCAGNILGIGIDGLLLPSVDVIDQLLPGVSLVGATDSDQE